MGFLNLEGLKHFYDKYLKPLKGAAKHEVTQSLTTNTAGYVLDARAGKTLDGKIAALNADLDGKADVVVLQNANTARSGIFFGDNLQNGAAGSGMEMIVACSDGTNVIQHSTVMSGTKANSVFVRRYLNNAWSPWTAK